MTGNTLTIIGNLTHDPELRFIQNGTALTKLGVAWNYRSQQGNENVSFFNVTCWGELGENVANSNLVKGSRVVIVGRLDQNSYETKEGEKRSTVQIIADEVSPSLRWATVDVTRIGGNSPKGDYGSQERATQETGSQEIGTGSQGTGTASQETATPETVSQEEEPF